MADIPSHSKYGDHGLFFMTVFELNMVSSLPSGRSQYSNVQRA